MTIDSSCHSVNPSNSTIKVYPRDAKLWDSDSMWTFQIQSGLQMGVSKNKGTPKSSILIGFSIINHPFWGTPIFGNTQMDFFVCTKTKDSYCWFPEIRLTSWVYPIIYDRVLAPSKRWLQLAGVSAINQVTFEGDYSAGIERLATLLVNHYGSYHLFPVVSVGVGPQVF